MDRRFYSLPLEPRPPKRGRARGAYLLLVFVLVAVGLTITTTEPTSSQTAPQYPNLKSRGPYDLQFDRETIDGTAQYVLRFSTLIWNSGTGPLHLVPVNSGSRTTVWQHIYASTTATGSPVEQHNAGESEFHAEHNHWHFQDFAKYELYTKPNWESQTGLKRGQGTKTTFCMIDYQRVSGSVAGRYFNCGQNDVTGLSVGWGDIYEYHLWDQWVVLGQSSLADGDYVLRVIADPLNKLHESSTGNGTSESIDDNQALTFFSVCSGQISLSACSSTGGPSNDNFANAETIGLPGSDSTNTSAATKEAGEPSPTCVSSLGKTVWYKLLPAQSGTLTATTAGSGFDTGLALYTGSSVAGLTQRACNDDISSSDLDSRLSFSVTSGQTYYLQAGGYNGAGGSLALDVSLQATSTATQTPTGTPTATAVSATPTRTPTPTSTIVNPTATPTRAATATPTQATAGPIMHVGDLDGSGSRQGGNNWRARVTITVHDASHNGVANAAVSGNWSTGYSGSGSCTTDSSGRCSIATGNIRNTTTSATFRVGSVSRSSSTYQSSSNHDPDEGSNGTSITISRP